MADNIIKIVVFSAMTISPSWCQAGDRKSPDSFSLHARIDEGRLSASLVNESRASLTAYGNRASIVPGEAGFALEITRVGGERARYCGMLDQGSAEVAELAPSSRYDYYDQVDVISRDYCLRSGEYFLHVIYNAPASLDGGSARELARSNRLDFRVD